eukprot:COSAG01_NODE_15068_length_1378_cov_1.847537_2_plen_35_part_01
MALSWGGEKALGERALRLLLTRGGVGGGMTVPAVL